MTRLRASVRQALRARWLFLKFQLAGVPAFALALLLNRWLVRDIGLPPPFAYAGVLLLQMTVNFLVCHLFVFADSERRALGRAYLAFLSGSSLLRLLDWGLYATLVTFRPEWYFHIQIANVLVFAFARFIFARLVFEQRRSDFP